MKTRRDILVLAYTGGQILDITGPTQMFAGANDQLGREAYRVRIAASDAEPDLTTSCGVQLVPHRRFTSITNAALSRTDTVIAVGGSAGFKAAMARGEIVDVLERAAARVPRIASVCTGGFFLAAAGLLDGKRVTTHWQSARRLQQFRPQAHVEPDAIHIRDGAIWTSAGVTAGIDLALAMIEADHGRATALAVARHHVVFRIRPGGQSQYSTDLTGRSATSGDLDALIARVSEAPERDWSVETLADAAHTSIRTLSRQFRKSIGVSPAEFVERVRLDAARRAILDSDAPLSTIAARSGFGSLRRMDRAFARLTGTTPTEFRQRFKSMEHENEHV